MKRIHSILIALVLLFGHQLGAQSIDLQLNTNKNCDQTTFCVDIQVQATTGSNAFEIGASSILLNYNPAALAFKSYAADQFSSTTDCGTGGSMSGWATHQFDAYSHPGLFNLVLYLNEGAASCPTILAESALPVGTICFDILQQGGNPNISYKAEHTYFNQYQPNNGSATVTLGTLATIDAADVLACDCPGADVACDDENVYTVNDRYDAYCNCKGEYLDSDQDGVLDGIDPCVDVLLEAEEATYEGPYFRNSQPQFFGLGYLDFSNIPTEYVQFEAPIAVAGTYQLDIRYSSDSRNRQLSLTINDSLINQDFVFPETEDYGDWQEVSLTYDFAPGTQIIRLGNSNTHGPYIDRLGLSICNDCTLAGMPCDDGNPCTTDDVYDADCNCGGRIVDTDEDQIADVCDPHIGDASNFPLITGLIKGVGDTWQTITLEQSFESMIVVATPHLPNRNMPPVVTRIRNASGNQFDLRIQNPSGPVSETYHVFYVVVEEGVYQEQYDGITMEAFKAVATKTGNANSWWSSKEARTYGQNYAQPVVLGQVMSDYNEAWSVFWASSLTSSGRPPSATDFAAGKNTGEDFTARVDEEIGVIVIEQGQYAIRDKILEATLGPETIRGLSNNGSQYTLSSPTASGAILSASGINGGNGYWPVLFGPSPVTAETMTLIADEDQVSDSERSHTDEEIAYLAFEDAICLNDADGDGVCDADDVCPGNDDLADVDKDGIPDACDTCDDTLVGTPCDDGIECTILDVYVDGCGCAGIPMDSDADGVCNWADQCEGFDDNIDIDGDGIVDGCDYNVGDASTMPLETGILTGVGDSWQTVSLQRNYSDMVVIASVHLLDDDTPPVVTRIRNAVGSSFELKVQNPSGSTDSLYSVYYFVANEGVYTEANDGVNMEVRTMSTELIPEEGAAQRQKREYLQAYTNPVVLGQVMSVNNDRWSVFWSSRDNNQGAPASSSRLAAGKHIGSDTTTYRVPETIGLIVLEQGTYTLSGINFEAAVGTNTITGVRFNNGDDTYPLSLSTPVGAVLSVAGMNGGDKGWPVFFGAQPFSANSMTLAFDEDQIEDTERSHTKEQVAYLAFEAATPIAGISSAGEKPYLPKGTTVATLPQLQQEELTLYPNPTSSLITAEAAATPGTSRTLLLLDVNGKVVFTQLVLDKDAPRIKQQLDISKLPNGIYFIHLLIDGQRQIRKFVKN